MADLGKGVVVGSVGGPGREVRVLRLGPPRWEYGKTPDGTPIAIDRNKVEMSVSASPAEIWLSCKRRAR